MGELANYLIQHDENFRKARLPALYSDFRPQRSLNPDGYRANLAAWRHALSLLARDGLLARHGGSSSVFVLNVDQSLLRSLENRQLGQPLALGTVIADATADKGLIPYQTFVKAPQNIYKRSWSEIPWSVMGWTLRQLGVVDAARGEDRLPEGRFVIMGNLEVAAGTLADRMADKLSSFERIFTKAQFQTQFSSDLVKGCRLSETDMDVLLQYLSRDRAMIVYDGQTIRIKGNGDREDQITDEDTAVASIKDLTASLTHQISLLNKRLEELDKSAREAVARKNRVAALAALKSKKLTESSLSKRYASLNQLEEVAAKLEQATDNAQLVKVMASSTDALKSLNAQIGSADRVDSIMDKLREQMNETDEVAAILAESSGTVVDEAEIDEELEAMELAERTKQEEARQKSDEQKRSESEAKDAAIAQRKLDELPAVPTAGDLVNREKAQTPTSETGIANLSIQDQSEPEKRKHAVLADS